MANQVTNENELIRAIEKLATIAKILWAILVIVVVGTAAGVSWVNKVDNRLTMVENNIGEIRTDLIADLMIRVRKLEDSIAPGILPSSQRLHIEAEKKIEKLRERLRLLEKVR